MRSVCEWLCTSTVLCVLVASHRIYFLFWYFLWFCAFVFGQSDCVQIERKWFESVQQNWHRECFYRDRLKFVFFFCFIVCHSNHLTLCPSCACLWNAGVCPVPNTYNPIKFTNESFCLFSGCFLFFFLYVCVHVESKKRRK